MLVLTRKQEQTITIGERLPPDEDAIEITVLEVKGDQVRIGIKAPRDMPVHRREIWELQKQEKVLAMISCAFFYPRCRKAQDQIILSFRQRRQATCILAVIAMAFSKCRRNIGRIMVNQNYFHPYDFEQVPHAKIFSN